MDAIRKIEAALPIVLYHHAEADGTFLPSESCVCEDDVYTDNGDDDTIGVPLVRLLDALAALASKDAEIARLATIIREFVEAGDAHAKYRASDGHEVYVTNRDRYYAALEAVRVAGTAHHPVALAQPTEQP